MLEIARLQIVCQNELRTIKPKIIVEENYLGIGASIQEAGKWSEPNSIFFFFCQFLKLDNLEEIIKTIFCS